MEHSCCGMRKAFELLLIAAYQLAACGISTGVTDSPNSSKTSRIPWALGPTAQGMKESNMSWNDAENSSDARSSLHALFSPPRSCESGEPCSRSPDDSVGRVLSRLEGMSLNMGQSSVESSAYVPGLNVLKMAREQKPGSKLFYQDRFTDDRPLNGNQTSQGSAPIVENISSNDDSNDPLTARPLRSLTVRVVGAPASNRVDFLAVVWSHPEWYFLTFFFTMHTILGWCFCCWVCRNKAKQDPRGVYVRKL